MFLFYFFTVFCLRPFSLESNRSYFCLDGWMKTDKRQKYCLFCFPVFLSFLFAIWAILTRSNLSTRGTQYFLNIKECFKCASISVFVFVQIIDSLLRSFISFGCHVMSCIFLLCIFFNFFSSRYFRSTQFNNYTLNGFFFVF